jgi:hypothetical protein
MPAAYNKFFLSPTIDERFSQKMSLLCQNLRNGAAGVRDVESPCEILLLRLQGMSNF